MEEIRPRLTKEEYQIILKYREEHQALIEECEAKGIPLSEVKHYWFKSERFSMFVNNKPAVSDRFIELIEAVQKHAPKYPKITYKPKNDSCLLVINPADVHIGKLASITETNDPHNNDIIIDRVLYGVDGLLAKSLGFNFDKILLVIGADILHIDTTKRTTTSGTPQDTDGMWFDNFKLAQKLYVKILERLITIAPVTVHLDPSNHDYMSGYYLAQVVEAWFRNVESMNFKIDISHRKYFKYYKNLIGTTHGDGAKKQDLPLLMAQEASEYWHDCRHRYFYTEHIHHKESKDYGSVCVESFRSPSGTDSWHHRNGYQHSPKALEAFIHHKEEGQIARITNIF